MSSSKNIKNYLLIIYFINLSFCYYKLPFYYITEKNITTKEQFFLSKKDIGLYTFLNIGTPSQTIASKLVVNEYCTYFGKEICNISNSFYAPLESSTFKNETIWELAIHDLKKGCRAEDIFRLNNSKNVETNITLEKFLYFTASIKDHGINDCGLIGFDYDYTTYTANDCRKFLLSTRRGYERLTNQIWSIIYNKYNTMEYDGYFILNSYPHEFNSLSFNGSNFTTVFSDKYQDAIKKPSYSIRFTEIYFYDADNNAIRFNKSNTQNLAGQLAFDKGLIQSTKEFFEAFKAAFKNNLEDVGKCETFIIENRYYTIFCNKTSIEDLDKFYDNFNNINFYHNNFQYNFEFTPRDIFVEFDDKLMLVFYYDKYEGANWAFGDVFLRKYFFFFDSENKQIGFYPDSPNGEKEPKADDTTDVAHSDSESESYKVYYIIGIAVVAIVCIGVGFYFGQKCIKKRRKKANELVDDDYDYEPKEKSDNDIN